MRFLHPFHRVAPVRLTAIYGIEIVQIQRSHMTEAMGHLIVLMAKIIHRRLEIDPAHLESKYMEA